MSLPFKERRAVATPRTEFQSAHFVEIVHLPTPSFHVEGLGRPTLTDERLFQEESLQAALLGLSFLTENQLADIAADLSAARSRHEDPVVNLERLFRARHPEFRVVFAKLQGLLAERLGDVDD